MGRRFKRIRICVFLALATGLLFAGCGHEDLSRFIPPAGKYDAKILRDNWGVAHVFGKHDPDAAYGLAFAHCEDDWVNFEDSLLLCRAKLASVKGKDFAKFDYLVQQFRVREFVDEKYEKDLSPDVRAVVEAYADGITHFAALNRQKMPHIELPITGKDIVAGSTFKSPFFYELHQKLAKIFGQEGAIVDGQGQLAREEGGGLSVRRAGWADWTVRPTSFANEAEGFGSNAWAVAPKRSADGATRIALNSHMPWSGPVTWYEAHVHSDDGWNVTGATFPVGPMLFVGLDENKAWTHTINRPHLADIYKLDMNPDNANQYKFDGQWRDLERGTARIKVKLWGPISWTFKREMLWSVHGPAFRRPGGVYALRFAGYGEVRELEQWFRMNKARNLDEFLAAMRIQGLLSLNTVYADKTGNLFYAYVGKFPIRAEGYDWNDILPGDTSKTVWTEF